MLRRLRRSGTALDHKQEELTRRESEVRSEVEKLERMIAEAPRMAQEVEKRQREELLMRACQGGSRLDVSLTLHDKRYGSGGGVSRPRGALRKERREGRIVFIVLVVAVLSVAIWLLNHLHF
jgi:septal ring factor EnvC (AmiA/AmiB activator)